MPVWMDKRELLLNALYRSMPEVPALVSFLKVACAVFSSSRASFLIGMPFDGHNRPQGFHDSEPYTDLVEAFAQPEFFTTLPLDDVSRHIMPAAGILSGSQTLILPVADEAGRTATIVLLRGADDPAFDAEAINLLRSLTEPMKRCLGIYHHFVGLERRSQVFGAALETSNIAVLLVDYEGTVLLSNAVADELLARGDGLRVHHGKLRAHSPGETTRLLEQVRANAAEQSARSDWSKFSPLPVYRDEQFLPLTVIVRPGPAFYPLKEPLRRTAMLIIRDPGRQALISASTLGQLFGLSPAEALLASELAAGANLDEASTSLGITRNTVRSQLQSIFQKTGTNRQVELVRVLLSSAAIAS